MQSCKIECFFNDDAKLALFLQISKPPTRSDLKHRKRLLSNLPLEKAILLHSACFLCNTELRIMNTEACRFNSAYRVSWSFACAELALRGLNGACSLWHDMSWAFCLCALPCLRWAGGIRVAAPSGFACNSDPVRLEGVCSKCLLTVRSSSVICMVRFRLKGDRALEMVVSHNRLWAGHAGPKGHSPYFQWHHARPEGTENA